MIIDFNRLRTFATVAQIGSITKAAIKLHLTQQAVSSQVQLLEQNLGVLLFKRANRRIYLTKEGQGILAIVEPHFKIMEQEITILVDDVASMDATLVLGANNEVAEILLTNKIAAFKLLYPDVQFELILANDAQTELAVLEGKLDMGFVVFSKELKLLNIMPFKREQFITVASKAYIHNSESPIENLKDLLQHQLVDFEPHCPSIKTWVYKNDKKLLSHFEYKTAAIAANDDRMIKRLLLANMGLANLPASLVNPELKTGELVEILPNSKKIEAGIDIICMRHKTPTLAATTFMDFMLAPKTQD